MLISEGQPDKARSWIQAFDEEVNQLPDDDVYRDAAKVAVAEWLFHMGETDQALPKFQDLIRKEKDDTRRSLLEARLIEMQLLLGYSDVCGVE